MTINDYKYACQATKPDWYGEGEINACAVSGNSPFNEWYSVNGGNGLSARQSFIDIIDETFISQSFHDNYKKVAFEYYDVNNLIFYEEEELYEIPYGVSPASIDEMVWAESRF